MSEGGFHKPNFQTGEFFVHDLITSIHMIVFIVDLIIKGRTLHISQERILILKCILIICQTFNIGKNFLIIFHIPSSEKNFGHIDHNLDFSEIHMSIVMPQFCNGRWFLQ